jgi:hypothetical protein
MTNFAERKRINPSRTTSSGSVIKSSLITYASSTALAEFNSLPSFPPSERRQQKHRAVQATLPEGGRASPFVASRHPTSKSELRLRLEAITMTSRSHASARLRVCVWSTMSRYFRQLLPATAADAAATTIIIVDSVSASANAAASTDGLAVMKLWRCSSGFTLLLLLLLPSPAAATASAGQRRFTAEHDARIRLPRGADRMASGFASAENRLTHFALGTFADGFTVVVSQGVGCLSRRLTTAWRATPSGPNTAGNARCHRQPTEIRRRQRCASAKCTLSPT